MAESKAVDYMSSQIFFSGFEIEQIIIKGVTIRIKNILKSSVYRAFIRRSFVDNIAFWPLLFIGIFFTVTGFLMLLLGLYLLILVAFKFYNFILVLAGMLLMGFGQAFKYLVEIRRNLR